MRTSSYHEYLRDSYLRKEAKMYDDLCQSVALTLGKTLRRHGRTVRVSFRLPYKGATLGEYLRNDTGFTERLHCVILSDVHLETTIKVPQYTLGGELFGRTETVVTRVVWRNDIPAFIDREGYLWDFGQVGIEDCMCLVFKVARALSLRRERIEKIKTTKTNEKTDND